MNTEFDLDDDILAPNRDSEATIFATEEDDLIGDYRKDPNDLTLSGKTTDSILFDSEGNLPGESDGLIGGADGNLLLDDERADDRPAVDLSILDTLLGGNSDGSGWESGEANGTAVDYSAGDTLLGGDSDIVWGDAGDGGSDVDYTSGDTLLGGSDLVWGDTDDDGSAADPYPFDTLLGGNGDTIVFEGDKLGGSEVDYSVGDTLLGGDGDWPDSTARPVDLQDDADDLNGDGIVDFSDLTPLVRSLQSDGGASPSSGSAAAIGTHTIPPEPEVSLEDYGLPPHDLYMQF